MSKKEAMKIVETILRKAYLDGEISRNQLDELIWKMLEEFSNYEERGE